MSRFTTTAAMLIQPQFTMYKIYPEGIEICERCARQGEQEGEDWVIHSCEMRGLDAEFAKCMQCGYQQHQREFYLYQTNAPVAYDAEGDTFTLKKLATGERIVGIRQRTLEWQLNRYASGFCPAVQVNAIDVAHAEEPVKILQK